MDLDTWALLVGIVATAVAATWIISGRISASEKGLRAEFQQRFDRLEDKMDRNQEAGSRSRRPDAAYSRLEDRLGRVDERVAMILDEVMGSRAEQAEERERRSKRDEGDNGYPNAT